MRPVVAETVTAEPEFRREMLGEWVHDVEWYGTFRGSDSDPRETGWCQECSREVYDGEGPHRQAGSKCTK